MKTYPSIKTISCQLLFCSTVAILAGCATSDNQASSGAAPSAAGGSSAYKATDGRTIGIGTSSMAGGGRNFKEPHMDKCWIADGFDFKGYNTLYIAPVTSTAKVHDDEIPVQKIAEENLRSELKRMIADKGFFGRVVTDESAFKPGEKTLKLTDTIIDYSKGGGAARYFVGLYGGGQPNLRAQGVMTDGDKTVFTYTMRRSGISGGARTGGAFMKDEDIQMQDIHSLVLDLTDFMAAIAGKYPPAN